MLPYVSCHGIASMIMSVLSRMAAEIKAMEEHLLAERYRL